MNQDASSNSNPIEVLSVHVIRSCRVLGGMMDRAHARDVIERMALVRPDILLRVITARRAPDPKSAFGLLVLIAYGPEEIVDLNALDLDLFLPDTLDQEWRDILRPAMSTHLSPLLDIEE